MYIHKPRYPENRMNMGLSLQIPGPDADTKCGSHQVGAMGSFDVASSQTVLIIEDMCNVSNLIRAAMLGRPIDVEMIRDGRKGLERARELIPALVLLDLALPGMHGFDVLRELKASPATANIPVIIVTAQGDSQTALEARRIGAQDFISKPFLITELRRAVASVLDPVTSTPLPTSRGGGFEERLV